MTLTIDGEIVDLARQRLKFHKEQAEKHTAAADRIEKRLDALDALMSELVDGFGLGLDTDVEPTAQVEEPKKPDPAPKPVAPYKPVPVPRHTPAHKQPAGTEFRLQDPETGKYLHEDINAMIANQGELHLVENKNYAWKGVEAKLLTVRKVLPDTMDLREVAIVKVPA